MTAGPGFPRFSGGFKTFRVTLDTNRETGLQRNLLVYSQGSRASVQKYLWNKFLWDELTKDEWELFYADPETLNNPIKYGALRALLIKGKREIREKLLKSPLIDEKDKPTRTRYQGIKGLRVEILHESRKLPKVPKFSGYVKSSSQVGTKSRRGPSFLEPLAINEDDYSDFSFDWYTYLTVGG